MILCLALPAESTRTGGVNNYRIRGLTLPARLINEQSHNLRKLNVLRDKASWGRESPDYFPRTPRRVKTNGRFMVNPTVNTKKRCPRTTF